MEVSILQLRVHGAAQLTRSSSFVSGTRPPAPCSPWSVVFPPCPPPAKDFHLCSGTSQVSGRRRRAEALASVRRSNCTDGFPVCSFHEDATLRDAREGINPTKFTSSYSPYSVALGSCVQPPLRQRLNRCDQIRRTIHRSS
jgi:hypothetical protein